MCRGAFPHHVIRCACLSQTGLRELIFCLSNATHLLSFQGGLRLFQKWLCWVVPPGFTPIQHTDLFSQLQKDVVWETTTPAMKDLETLKNKSFQSFPVVHVCGKILRAQSNTVGVVLGCAFNWASEMGTSFIFLSYWCLVGSVMFQFRANSSSVWSYWKCQGLPQSDSCFLSGHWRKNHGQALSGILQEKSKQSYF